TREVRRHRYGAGRLGQPLLFAALGERGQFEGSLSGRGEPRRIMAADADCLRLISGCSQFVVRVVQ
ncbi:MAG: hypothetical protein IKC57_01135, partial [Alistipes sp.]|nr:hypothetical protein [Alistipes sp.]